MLHETVIGSDVRESTGNAAGEATTPVAKIINIVTSTSLLKKQSMF
jgi:hypothetical protein